MGVLHSPKDRRPSLALDLMEEWRPIVVDGLVMKMVNQLEIREDLFVHSAASGGVIMEKNLLTKFLYRIGNRMDEEIRDPKSGKVRSIKRWIYHQAMECRRVIEGKIDSYTPIRRY